MATGGAQKLPRSVLWRGVVGGGQRGSSAPESLNVTSVPINVDRSSFTAAFTRRAQEIAAVTEEQLVPINLEVNQAVSTVLGTLPEIASLRTEIASLRQIDQKAVEGLEDYALATGEANSRYTMALAPHGDIVALSDEALDLRDLLRSDATALARRGLVDSGRLGVFKNASGYKNVAYELVDYATLLNDAWPKIQGKTGLTAEELIHAKEVGEQLARAAGEREQAPVIIAEAARIRQQAFSLLMHAYDETRRAISFLRWREDDVDSITPSLFTKSRVKPTAAPAGDTTAVTGTPAAATTPVTPNAPRPAAVAPGMPGSSPFTN